MNTINRLAQRPTHGGPAKTYKSAVVARSGNTLERWRQHYEHYRGLAENTRDFDLVARENYWQHAEHFFRMIAEQRNPGSALV